MSEIYRPNLETRGISLSETNRAKLRLIHQYTYNLLRGPKSNSQINYYDPEEYFERLFDDEVLKASSIIEDLKALPQPDSTFIILLHRSNVLILLPPQTDSSYAF